MKKTNLPLLYLALIAGMLLFMPGTASANQPLDHPDTAGTDFWLAFAQNYSSSPTLTLFITSDVDTNGTVEVPGLSFSTSFSVTAGTVTTVSVPANAQLNGADTTENKGIHVTAEDEITVYGLNRVQYTTDAYLGLPTNILGTEYVALSYENSYAHNGTQLAIVATVDNTTVSIIPSVTTSGHTAGVSYDVTLNRGETYQLRSNSLSANTPPPSPPGPPPGPIENLTADTDLNQVRDNQRQEVNESAVDLSGTIITATEPIAVFGGSQCANIPALVSACDHIVEQLTPTSTWGKSFVTMPLATRTKGDTFRFLAATDNTTVNVNGTDVATLNRGELHEMIIEDAAQITANEPILVAQYSNSSQFDGVTSDPFMMLIPPYEQFLASYTVTTPATGFAQNFVNVVVPDASVGAVTLDGTAIPAGDYVAIGSSGFSGAQVTVSAGSHALAGPQPFGTFMYGFDSYDSYGYPGGASLAEVATVTKLTLSPPTATNPVDNEHCVIATVTDQNDDPVPGVRVDFVVAGVNPTSGFATADENGQAQFCYTGANAGADTITASVGDLSDDATANWQALPPPDLSISKEDGQTTINPGDTLIYTITASNTSATNATGVTISDTLPAHTTFVSASDGGSEASGVVTWNVGALNGGASVSRTVTVQVNDPLPDDVEEITNRASVADDGNNGVDPTPGNNTDSDVDGVQKDPPQTSCEVDFNAQLEWEWTTSTTLPESNQVTMTPMVMDMNADGSADILFITHLDKDLHQNAHLRVINGHDGSEIFTISDEQYDLHGGSQLAVGDIDLDGKPEILAISELDELIAFEHDGTFKWRSDPILKSNPNLPDLFLAQAAPSIADLNQDGTPEIVVGHHAFDNQGNVLWIGEKGRGDHRWGPLSMVLDLDLDGKPEVLAGNSAYRANGDLYWHYNPAADGFTTIGNLDDDDHPEILLITYGKIRALEHDGTLKWNLVEFPGVGSGGAPVVGDVDGDGQVEIGVANNEYYMLYEADGTLKWQVSVNDSNSGVASSSLFDFDGDGAPEILYSDHLNMYIFNGNNGAILWQTQSTSRGGYEYPVVADVDNDGRAEIIMSSNNKVQPAIGGNHGIQVYGHESWPSTREVWNQYSYHINNVNDNGSIPQNESNSWQEHNTYHLNPSDGCGDEPPSACTANFSADSKQIIDQDFDGSISVYPADIDGDGDVDVLGAAQYGDDIAWWENDGSGTLTKHLIDDNFDGAFSVYADDVDKDGDLDVLGAAFGTNQVAWWDRNVDGTWTKHVIGTGTLGAYSVRTGDFDGDGDRDAVGAFVDDKIVWWANNGDSLSWTEHVIDSDFDGAQAVEVADLDGDGHLDILGASRYGNEITWWENGGNGSSWTEHLIDDYFRYAVSIQAADVDGDGDLDLLGAATTSDDITWWENDGNAAGWTEHLIDGEFDGASWVDTADMDKDGDLDVLGAGRDGGGEISWWENDGTGSSWSKHLVDNDFDGGHSVFAADMDGDNDLDLVGAAYRADDVAWWGNDCMNGTTLILDPPTETMRVSETITIDVMVNQVVDLRSVHFKLEFNQDVLEVVDADTGTDGLQITPGSCPQSDTVVVNGADNSTGVVEYAATSFSASCSPNGVVAQIAFHAHAEGKGWVKFTSWGLSNSLGQPIEVNGTKGSSIVVEDERTGHATGTVRLLGREIHSDTGQPYHNGATVKVIDGDDTVIASATTNAAGEYQLTDIPVGTYTVRAEMDLYLYAERELVVEAGQTTTLPHVNLWPGENNGDNKVNILDLQPLFQLFDAGESFANGMTCASPPTWNPSTEALQAKLDFNADCEINVGDIALHSTSISAFFAGNGANAPVGLNVPIVPLTPGSQALAPTPWE